MSDLAATTEPAPRLNQRGRPAPPERLVRIVVNLLGAAGAAFFARATLVYYLQSHRVIGAAFLVEQAWFVIAFLLRRPARSVSGHLGRWLLAAAGTFAGLLFRPDGVHTGWGVQAGVDLQPDRTA